MAGTAGIIASGHELTSAAAAEVLAAGGNAFDAALAGLCAACVAEPLLTSLGGGGFLLARPADQEAVVFDFFAHTPAHRRPAPELDFYPILADFGAATQEFHIGLGAMAIPGNVAGIFQIHRSLGQIPMAEIMAPAIEMARAGVAVTSHQETVSQILASILGANPAAMELVATDEAPDRIAMPGEIVRNPDLANTFEALLRDGPEMFYQGDFAVQLSDDCRRAGGMLSREDLANYEVINRQPIRICHQGTDLYFNAPPSPGGTLLAFALEMLGPVDFQHQAWGSSLHAGAIASAVQAASQMRSETGLDSNLNEHLAEELLSAASIAAWRERAMPHALFSRGTTHLSVVDEYGNVASLTSSNGEGSAYVLPGSGVMMNNMLGEEDLNPDGFHRWPVNARLASMMCPTVATRPDGTLIALGSGGSNRIRSAVLQVLVNLLGLGMPLNEAVTAPRLHLEHGDLSVEAGYPETTLDLLGSQWPDFTLWPGPNMFFGGVHAAERLPSGDFRGMGDPRRGGAVAGNRSSHA